MEKLSSFQVSNNSPKFEKFFQEIQEKNPEDFEMAVNIVKQIQQAFSEAIALKLGKNATLDYFEKQTLCLIEIHPLISDNTEHLLTEMAHEYSAQLEKTPIFNVGGIKERIAKIFQK